MKPTEHRVADNSEVNYDKTSLVSVARCGTKAFCWQLMDALMYLVDTAGFWTTPGAANKDILNDYLLSVFSCYCFMVDTHANAKNYHLLRRWFSASASSNLRYRKLSIINEMNLLHKFVSLASRASEKASWLTQTNSTNLQDYARPTSTARLR